jgi:hypothetical protein
LGATEQNCQIRFLFKHQTLNARQKITLDLTVFLMVMSVHSVRRQAPRQFAPGQHQTIPCQTTEGWQISMMKVSSSILTIPSGWVPESGVLKTNKGLAA